MKIHRLISVCVGAAALAAITAFPSYAAGWRQNSAGYWYEREDKSYPAGSWEQIEGKWYLFDGNGYMLTGWQQIGDVWYYLGTDGAMAAGTVLTIDGVSYAFDSSGAMKEQTKSSPAAGHFEGPAFINEWSNIRLAIPQGFVTLDASALSELPDMGAVTDGAILDMAAVRNENCGILVFYMPDTGDDTTESAMAYLNMFTGGSHAMEGGGTIETVQAGSARYLRFYFPPGEQNALSCYVYLRDMDGFRCVILALWDAPGADYIDSALSTLTTVP